MKLSKTAAKVIDIARQIQSYWNTELPKRHPNYPLISPGEDSGPAPPQQAKLKELLANLPIEEIHQLIFLMYLGRGDFGTNDLATNYSAVKRRFRRPESAISQMAGKVPLADYLADGLAELRKIGVDLDHLTFASAKVEK
jgi:Protein of unknown function (DUF3775)